APHLLAGSLVGLRRGFAQRVDSTMDVGVLSRVVMADRIDYDLRLLCRGRIIEVDKRLPLHVAFEDRKVFSDALHVKTWLRHIVPDERPLAHRTHQLPPRSSAVMWSRAISRSSN